jgi:hypothetical protein
MKEYTSIIEKLKKGWRWSVYENGIHIAGDPVRTKAIAKQSADNWITFYKKQDLIL